MFRLVGAFASDSADDGRRGHSLVIVVLEASVHAVVTVVVVLLASSLCHFTRLLTSIACVRRIKINTTAFKLHHTHEEAEGDGHRDAVKDGDGSGGEDSALSMIIKISMMMVKGISMSTVAMTMVAAGAMSSNPPSPP